MAKTIYEMSEKEYPKAEDILMHTQHALAYRKGANAVLKEIEDVLGLLPDTTARRVVANKIKELKGNNSERTF